MGSELNEGDVVITSDTNQGGTIFHLSGDKAWVLLRNGNIWIESVKLLRKPQEAEELESTVLDVERPAPKRKKRSGNRSEDT